MCSFFLKVAFLALLCISQSNCDYYSSVSGLEKLLTAEALMIENLEHYLRMEEMQNDAIEEFLDLVVEELYQAMQDPGDYYGNPLNGFKTIKRITRNWRNLYLTTVNKNNENDFFEDNAYLDGLQFEKPVESDLTGASDGISRLQQTYNILTKDLSQGVVLNQTISGKMSASDCLELGKGLFKRGNYKMATTWLLQSRLQASQEPPITKEQDIEALKHIVLAFNHLDNTKLALWFAKEWSDLDPEDTEAAEIKRELSYKMDEMRTDAAFSTVSIHRNEKTETEPSVQELYEKTCRGELFPTPRQQRDLQCRYDHNDVPFCLLARFKVEELSLDPYVAVYYDAIYESEMANVIQKTENQITRSQVGIAKEGSIVSDIRTSKNSWLWYHEHDFLYNIYQRLVDITGLRMESAEALQVANYGIGGHYGPHYDFTENAGYDFDGRGNRILTALFYINDIELGGATAFPFIPLAVPPIKGSLVMWYNMHESLELDYRTKHAGCPVLKGSKWICNEWFHERLQEFNRPCSLHRDGEISLKFKTRH